MKYKTGAFMLLLTACLSSLLMSYDRPAGQMDLYILAGQSNMAGRGVVTDELKSEGNARVMMYTKEGKWVEARHPLHFDKPKVVGVGPGLAFGIAMAVACPRVRIGLIPCAVGGSPIEHWEPGAYDEATGTHPYDDAVARIKAAMTSGTVKGIIWHQGESNSSAERSAGYIDKLSALIGRLRAVTGNKDLPFIAGELGRYRPAYNIINTQLALLADRVPHTSLATSEGLVHKGDTTHFDSPSAEELGRRYAAQMLKVQKQLPGK